MRQPLTTHITLQEGHKYIVVQESNDQTNLSSYFLRGDNVSTYHADILALARKESLSPHIHLSCIGGGYYRVSGHTIHLYGLSTEFGSIGCPFAIYLLKTQYPSFRYTCT